MISTEQHIILASGSETRRKMLQDLDLNFSVIKSNLDEDELKKNFSGGIEALGLFLARAKAKTVSQANPESYVIAADQVCSMQGQIFDKPGNRETCFKHLKELSGKTHEQNCSACIFYNGTELWQYVTSAQIKMRLLSDEEIKAYIEIEKPFNCAGSYMLEKHGKHLFADIKGDHDVILGLPLVEILNFLYSEKVIRLV